MSVERLQNYVGGEWIDSTSKTTGQVHNPATGELIGECPFSTKDAMRNRLWIRSRLTNGSEYIPGT